MGFLKDATLVRTNGRSVVSVQPVSGAYTDIGFVANVIAKASVLKEPTTLGNLPVGWNLSIEGEAKQVGGASGSGVCATWAALLANPFPTAVKVVGLKDTATILQPTLTAELDMKFDGKTGSMMKFSAEFEGADVTTASNFITANS